MGIKAEKKKWDKVFALEAKKNITLQNLFSSYWWNLHYLSITKLGDSLIKDNPQAKVIEVGCGSGKITLLLKQPYKQAVLVDISEIALKFAQKIAGLLNKENKIKTYQADMFNLPFPNNSFDLCWGLGVLEHYHINQIIKAVREMLRITVNGGYIAIGFPNPRSLAFKKASFLGDNRFKFITNHLKGYRNDTEIAYKPEYLINKIKQSFPQISNVKVVYTSSITLVDTPRLILDKLTIFEKIFYRHKFIYFLVLQK